MGTLRRRCANLRAVFTLLYLALFISSSVGVAFAGTTGVLHGTVTDTATHQPLANVAVTAAAASGHYSTTTDSRGSYTITGVYPDTYTVSFQLNNYEPVSEAGITVFADQTQDASVSLTKSLKTIAKVTSRSQGGAFQPNQTVDTYSVTSSQIQQIQGNAINISESNLITSLPGASYDSSGYPVIHGGRENEEGFQFEGIPYVDAFTNQFTNTLATPGLGLQSAQLTPGAGDATFGNTGTGTLNLIAKRGSYPGYLTTQLSAGGPNYFHALNMEFGTAAADGRWSEYAAYAGQNTGFRYGSGQPAAEILRFRSTSVESDREFINNFVYKFGKNMQQNVQFFIDLADHHFYQGYGGNPYCFKTCDPVFTSYVGGFTGLTPTQIGNIMTLDPYQTSPTETLAQANRAVYTYYQPNETYKLQYSNNLNSSTFFSAKYYRVNAVTTFDFPYVTTSPTYPTFVLQQGGFTTGGTLELTKQLTDKNLLQAGADFAWLHPVYNQPSNTYGLLDLVFNNFEQYDFVNPNDPQGCPAGPGGCGYLYNYFPNGVKIPDNLEQSISNRQDVSLYVNDKMDFSPKFKAEVGLRMDAVNYKLPTPQVDPTTCTTEYIPATWTANPNYNPAAPYSAGNCPFNATFDVTNKQIRPRIYEPRIGLTYNPTPTDSIRFTYGRSVLFAPLGQIDLYVPAGAYAAFDKVPSYLNPALFGPNPGPASCGIPGYQVPCASYGDQLRWDASNTYEGVPLQPVKPETFSNTSVTLEHQFTKGFLQGVSVSIAPWYRRGFDAVAAVQTPRLGPNGQPITNPDGTYVYNPPVATNRGTDFADGIDFRITKEAPVGFSGQLSASYINEFSNVLPLSGNEDFFPTLPPASLALGNLYRVGFLSPFQAVLALQYKTKSGWRFNPQFDYDIGYPIGAGLTTAAFVNGTAYNIPNTNASGAINAAPNGAAQFVDPMNPGSYFHPNVVATRGTPEASSPGGKLSSPDFFANMTVEYDSPKNWAVGLTVNNVFNQMYPGVYYEGFNPRYQPIANGVSGPLTGYSTDRNAYVNTNLGYTPVYSSLIHGQEAYLNPPLNQGRLFYVYFQVKI